MVTFVWICSRTLSTTGGKTPSLGTPLGAEIMQIQKNDLQQHGPQAAGLGDGQRKAQSQCWERGGTGELKQVGVAWSRWSALVD